MQMVHGSKLPRVKCFICTGPLLQTEHHLNDYLSTVRDLMHPFMATIYSLYNGRVLASARMVLLMKWLVSVKKHAALTK